jgi:hypothetical protein
MCNRPKLFSFAAVLLLTQLAECALAASSLQVEIGVDPYLLVFAQTGELGAPIELPYQPMSGVFEAQTRQLKLITSNAEHGVDITLQAQAEMKGLHDASHVVPLTIAMAPPNSASFAELRPATAVHFDDTQSSWNHDKGVAETRAPFTLRVSSSVTDPQLDKYTGAFTLSFAQGL